jgi:hypothetical protein
MNILVGNTIRLFSIMWPQHSFRALNPCARLQLELEAWS